MTLELAPRFPNFHTTLMGGDLNLDIFNVHRPPLPLHDESSAEPRRPRVRYLDRWATAATCFVVIGIVKKTLRNVLS
ncbi:hypothetical protein TNCV_1764301 [Trichonephila clavipes]|nr:hypothetical protein TNCV_1764301 [Trichonephila clavipes]